MSETTPENDTGTVTGQQIKEAMISNGITRVDTRNCSICMSMLYYSRDGEQLYFHPRCDCIGKAEPEARDWSHIADWINMQDSIEIKSKLAERFGLRIDR